MSYSEVLAELQQSNIEAQTRLSTSMSALSSMVQSSAQSQMEQIHGIKVPHGLQQSGPNALWSHKATKFAKNLLGIDYVYGAETPKQGFDCSGLVQYIYGHMGMELPRTAAEQGMIGHHVKDLGKLRRGDLVFYNNDPSDAAADHVGIYWGPGKVFEAPRPGGHVQISALSYPGAGEMWGIRMRPRRRH